MDNDKEVKRAIVKSIHFFKRSSQGGCRIWNRSLTYQADTMPRPKEDPKILSCLSERMAWKGL